MVSRRPCLIALLGLLLVSQACTQDLNITLNQNEVTGVPLGSLFNMDPTAKPRMSGLQQAAPVTTYTTSHPAAYIKSFDEASIGAAIADLTGVTAIDFWTFQYNGAILHVLINNNWFQFAYANSVLTPVEGWTPIELTGDGTLKCNGLDFTTKVVVIGCTAHIAAEDPEPAKDGINLYSYVKGALVPTPTFIEFAANGAISGRIRVDITPDSDNVIIYDDMFTSGGANVATIYYSTLVDTTGIITYVNAITQLDTYTPASIQDTAFSLGDEGQINAVISFFDTQNGGALTVASCQFVLTTPGTPPVDTYVVDNCVEQGIAALQVKAGTAKYYPGYTTPIFVSQQIAIFNNDPTNGISVWQCFFNTTTSKFTDCQNNIRALPNAQVPGTVATYITNFDGNLAFNLQTTVGQSKLNWAIVNVARTNINGNLFGLGFDSILDTTMLGYLAPTKLVGAAIFQSQTKYYGVLDQNFWNVIIESNGIQANQNSNVKVNRAAIIVTQTSPTNVVVTKFLRVWVISEYNDVFGFTDNLPDFGGLAGGALTTNVDRTWFYGNNLQWTVTGSSIQSSSQISTKPLTYTFDAPANPVFTNLQMLGSFEVIASDATNLYYYSCPPNVQAGTAACTTEATVALPQGFTIVRAYSTTSYPENGNAAAIIVLIANAGVYKYWYISRWQLAQSVLKDLDATQTFRDVHVVNFRDNLMFFTAPLTAGNTEKLWVYTGPNTAAGALAAPFEILPADNGMPDGVMAPSKITSCGHNDYVLEFLSGNGYIIKMNIISSTAVSKRGIVRLVLPLVPTFKATGFCPFGDEFLVWDDNQNLFTTSTLNDPTQYRINLGDYNFVPANGIKIRCARLSASASIWGTDSSGTVLIMTIFGNQQNVAHSKIHSVVNFGTKTMPPWVGLYSTLPGAVSHVSIGGQTTPNAVTVSAVFLGGPYIELQFKPTIADPFLTWTLTSGNQNRQLVQQANLGQIYRNVTVNATSKPTLTTGNFSLESSALIVGHVETASLNVPASLQDSISLIQRSTQLTPSPALHGLKATNIQIKLILGSYQGCFLYLAFNTQTNVLLALNAGSGCKESDSYTFPVGQVDLTGIDGAINDKGFALAYVNKVGGAYTTFFVYHSFTVGTQDIVVTNTDDRGYISSVRLAPWPDWVHFGVSVSVKIHDRCDILVADISDPEDYSFNSIDSINSCYNLWPVANKDGSAFLWNNYRDTVLNLYALSNPAAPGTSSQIGFDGSNNEIRDVKCVAGTSAFSCAAVTFGPTSTYFTVSYNNTNWQVTGLSTRSLQNFIDATGAGSYHAVDIVDGFVALMSKDGFIDLYKTDANLAGYLYTRLPKPAATGLGDSLIHGTQYKDFAITAVNSGNGWTPMVTRVSKAQTALNDVADQSQSFSIQPLTLQVSQQPNGDDATKIMIGLGSGGQAATVPFDDFFTPEEPKPQPKPDKGSNLTWLWILLIIIGVAAIGAGVFFVLKNRKEKGAEEGAYYEKNEPLADGEKKKSQKADDEFN